MPQNGSVTLLNLSKNFTRKTVAGASRSGAGYCCVLWWRLMAVHKSECVKQSPLKLPTEKWRQLKSSLSHRMFYPQYEVLNNFMSEKPTSSNSENSQHGTDAVRQKDARYSKVWKGVEKSQGLELLLGRGRRGLYDLSFLQVRNHKPINLSRARYALCDPQATKGECFWTSQPSPKSQLCLIFFWH